MCRMVDRTPSSTHTYSLRQIVAFRRNQVAASAQRALRVPNMGKRMNNTYFSSREEEKKSANESVMAGSVFLLSEAAASREAVRDCLGT